jgi:radical SAM/Cys-rich protein
MTNPSKSSPNGFAARPARNNSVNPFAALLQRHGRALQRAALHTLQINVGRKCNQTCRHCHVDAAPWRTEMISAETAGRIGCWIQQHRPPVVDLTGGAPELSEHFRYLVETSRSAGAHVIDRNNLTIIETDSFSWLPEYLAHHQVEVVASLPCYLGENVDAQRGGGVFEKSIRALQKLNSAGYGRTLPLTLVYNPLGPRLPPPQAELENDYRLELREKYQIEFTRLFTITNQPIARFAEDLRAQNQWQAYLDLLAANFNPATIDGLMCRTTLSVGWRGELYDCDFNQMLNLHLPNQRLLYLWDITPSDLPARSIQTALHCLACTAGSGSSCTGALASTAAN